MKHLLFICLSLITTWQAISQQTTIKVGTNTNDGTGDNLRNAFIKANQNDYNLQLTATASGTDTYTISFTAPAPGWTTGIIAPTTFVTDGLYRITFTNANTGAATLTLGAQTKDIKNAGNTTLTTGDIKAGATYILVYNGTFLQIIGGSGGGTWGSITGTLSNQTDLQNTFNTKQGTLTNSAGLASALSDESGTGTVIFSSYADAKVADAINDATTTIAPSQNAVFDALALKGDADADLTAIANLTAANGDFLYRESGVWVNKTTSQTATIINSVAGDPAFVTVLAIHADAATGVILTNQANTEQSFANAGRTARYIDITGFNYIQVAAQVSTASASVNTPRLYPQYSTDNVTYTLIGTGTGTNIISLATTGQKITDWIALPSAAKTLIYLRVAQNGGDGAADPEVGSLEIRLKK